MDSAWNENMDSNRDLASSHLHYKKKYKQLKRLAWSFILENKALHDKFVALREEVNFAEAVRKTVIKKLSQFESLPEQGLKSYSNDSSVPKKITGKRKSNTETTEGGKPAKTTKRQTANKGRKQVQAIPLDDIGVPIFPIQLGHLTVHSIGEICSRYPAYHTEECIYPAGYCSTRIYGSLSNPEYACVYTCKIIDNGATPLFEIAADNEPELPIVGQSPTECHSKLLSLMNEVVGTEVVNTEGRGAEFFGLTNSVILNLIQSCPGSKRCSGYRWTKFDVCKGPTASKEDEVDASLSFDTLQRNISFFRSHQSYGMKYEPFDIKPEPFEYKQENVDFENFMSDY